MGKLRNQRDLSQRKTAKEKMENISNGQIYLYIHTYTNTNICVSSRLCGTALLPKVPFSLFVEKLKSPRSSLNSNEGFNQ